MSCDPNIIQANNFFTDATYSIFKWGMENPQTSNTISPNWCEEMLKTDIELQGNNLEEINKESLEELETSFYQQNVIIDKQEDIEKGIKLNLIEKPYYKKLSRNLWLLIQMKDTQFTWHRKYKIHLLNCDKECLKRIELLEDKITSFKSLLFTTFKQDVSFKKDRHEKGLNVLKDFLLQFLTPRDLGLLLGLFETDGSLFRNLEIDEHLVLLPSVAQCIAAFSTCHKPKYKVSPRKGVRPTQLTAGARALTKHWHRDRTAYFWPQCSGTEYQKNSLANKTLIKLINEMAWTNLHLLPGGKSAFEIRNHLGYGARWELKLKLSNESNIFLVDKVVFRGLLEPPMVGGHAIGWLH